MTMVSATAASVAGRRFSLAFWLKGFTARTRATGFAPRRGTLEALERRVMFSAAAVSTPDYVIATWPGTNIPEQSTGPSGFTPAQIKQAYGINQVRFGSVVGDGTGQTIAIVDAYSAPTLTTDVQTFDQTFGLPAIQLTIIGQDGSSNLPGTDPAGPGDSWAGETSLDVEWAHAVAPGAKIVLVEANSADDADLFTAVDTARNYPGVSVVSMSWSGDEINYPFGPIYDSTLTTPAGHTGVTFVASTGDFGSQDGDVNYPASSINVLAVGGTSLTVAANGNYASESAWDGAGGGLSTLEAEPSYQRGVVTQTNSVRAVPDVSMDADPDTGVAIIDTWDNGSATPWLEVGGTSLSAPLWAGVIALADQGLAAKSQPTLDGPTQTLPDIYALPSADFHDIASGSNGLFTATKGYDLVTGRGTPFVNLVVAALSGNTVSAPLPSIGALVASPALLAAGAPVTLTATGLQTPSSKVNHVAVYAESGKTPGFQIGQDILLGDATVSGTTATFTIPTDKAAVGIYTYYAVLVDGVGDSSAAVATTVTIVGPPANASSATAVVITGTLATVSGTNIGATTGSGAVLAGNSGGKAVWWTWTAPVTGEVSLNTLGSNFDTLLGVFEAETTTAKTAKAAAKAATKAAAAKGGSVPKLTLIASDDEELPSSNITSDLTFTATAGTVYYFAVDGFSTNKVVATGDITLNLSEAPGPSNDNFANALVLTGNNVSLSNLSNVGATREPGEPEILGNPGGASIWFSWTAATTGPMQLSTNGSQVQADNDNVKPPITYPQLNTLLAVYTGSALSNLILVAANDDASNKNLTSALSFNAVAGTTYYFTIDGYEGAMGSDLQLTLT